MKKIDIAEKKNVLFFVLLCFVATLKAQAGNADLSVQERSLSGFTIINVDDGIDVYLSMGKREIVRVRANHHLIRKIKTERVGKELKIRLEGSYKKPEILEVHVEISMLEGIKAQGGSDIYTTGIFNNREFELYLSQGSDICIALEAQKITCDLSGGSVAKLSGRASFLQAASKAGSALQANKLEANKCKLQADGGSDMSVWVKGELEMEAYEASIISYLGSPTILYQRASADSDIRRQ